MFTSVSLNSQHSFYFLFFFNDTATTEIYTLSLHDALPIYTLLTCTRRETNLLLLPVQGIGLLIVTDTTRLASRTVYGFEDRKSTRLNSSHGYISYAVFCLKKKNTLLTNHDQHITIPVHAVD